MWELTIGGGSLTFETVVRELASNNIQKGSIVVSKTDKAMKDQYEVVEIAWSGCVLKHTKAKSATRKLANSTLLDSYKAMPKEAAVVKDSLRCQLNLYVGVFIAIVMC